MDEDLALPAHSALISFGGVSARGSVTSLLTLTLDRPVTLPWLEALHNMGTYTSVFGKPPQVFSFQGDKATVSAAEHEAQLIIDHFKTWLPRASQTLKVMLEEAAKRDEAATRERLRRERAEEEQRLRVTRNLRI